MKNGGVLRLVSVFLICTVLIGYNVYTKAIKKKPTDNAFVDVFGQDTFAFSEEKEIINQSEKEPSSSSINSQTASAPSEASSVAASASGNVKGRIITNYISPYNANTSYDKVYLKNSTDLKINIKDLLDSKLSFNIEKNDKPMVLIVHTHTTEAFMSKESDTYDDTFTSRSRDHAKSVVGVGNIVADKLNAAGIKTIHDTTEHDYPKYTGSYSRSAVTINSNLKKYPSIRIVIDLHRDAVSAGNGDKVKLVTEIGGKKAAQVMIVMGSQSGGITNFPNWKENLKLAVRVHRSIESKYPTLARPIMFMSKNYNESLTKGSMLIEFGTDANTIDEVHYSAEMVGNALSELLSNLK